MRDEDRLSGARRLNLVLRPGDASVARVIAGALRPRRPRPRRPCRSGWSVHARARGCRRIFVARHRSLASIAGDFGLRLDRRRHERRWEAVADTGATELARPR